MWSKAVFQYCVVHYSDEPEIWGTIPCWFSALSRRKTNFHFLWVMISCMSIWLGLST